MARKYTHPLTKELNPDNWKEKINLNDLSLDEMIAIFGDMKAMEKLSKAIAGFMREAVNARLPDDEYETEDWAVIRSEKTRAGNLDVDAITEEMGEEWVEDHRQDATEYVEIRISRVEQ